MLSRVTVPFLLLFFAVIFNVGHGRRFRRQGNFIWGTDDFEPSTIRPSASNFVQQQQQQQQLQSSGAFVDCTRNCQTTSQYDPVCGSDRETYTNPQRLQCARKCGKVVQQLFRGSCAPM